MGGLAPTPNMAVGRRQPPKPVSPRPDGCLVSNRRHGSMPLRFCIYPKPSLRLLPGTPESSSGPAMPLLSDLEGSPNLSKLLLVSGLRTATSALDCAVGGDSRSGSPSVVLGLQQEPRQGRARWELGTW